MTHLDMIERLTTTFAEVFTGMDLDQDKADSITICLGDAFRLLYDRGYADGKAEATLTDTIRVIMEAINA